jgi:hypothetical protein
LTRDRKPAKPAHLKIRQKIVLRLDIAKESRFGRRRRWRAHLGLGLALRAAGALDRRSIGSEQHHLDAVRNGIHGPGAGQVLKRSRPEAWQSQVEQSGGAGKSGIMAQTPQAF